MDLDDDLPRDLERDAEWDALGESSQDVERVQAGDLEVGDRVIVDGRPVVVESLVRDGDVVWVRVVGEKLRAPADAEVERLR